MIKFEIIRTGEIKQAYSLEVKGDKTVVRYSEKGKEYRYNSDNLRILPPERRRQPRYSLLV